MPSALTALTQGKPACHKAQYKTDCTPSPSICCVSEKADRPEEPQIAETLSEAY